MATDALNCGAAQDPNFPHVSSNQQIISIDRMTTITIDMISVICAQTSFKRIASDE